MAEHSFQVPMPNSPLPLNYLCFGARFLQESILSSTRTTSCRTLLSTGRASAFTMKWVWFLNLAREEDVERN